MSLRYLHTLIRVPDLQAALDFYQGVLGMVEVRRMELDEFRLTNVFLAAPHDVEAASSPKFSPTIEICWYWDQDKRDYFTRPENRWGHIAYRVDDIYAFCAEMQERGLTINLPPRNGLVAIFTAPDGTQIEVVQEGGKRPAEEPWASMPNAGKPAV